MTRMERKDGDERMTTRDAISCDIGGSPVMSHETQYSPVIGSTCFHSSPHQEAVSDPRELLVSYAQYRKENLLRAQANMPTSEKYQPVFEALLSQRDFSKFLLSKPRRDASARLPVIRSEGPGIPTREQESVEYEQPLPVNTFPDIMATQDQHKFEPPPSM
eukprot:CAMPEP_0117682886 /NCGR_PEP_ID=MMETSP0804-20121206/19990_1 /TAXON_ID=1074897 /ORGANISM="Tetraselmis astigmatica, Strain CCMP880" /LENGTH=160 /DNA_ID=CAMNT_0005493211 /DNA_START=16 /DNA_END=498 /DNA_ORIENTATION=+